MSVIESTASLSLPEHERPKVINIGPLYIGSPCAQLQATYPTISCKSAYYVVVKVNQSQLWSMKLP